jgi:hypothetical protein
MRGQAKTLEELLRVWSAKGRHILVLIQLSLRSTQLLLVRPAYGHFLRAFECMFVWIFGCHHRHLSRVFTIDRQTYQVCFACGAKLRYSWRTMSLVRTENVANAGVVLPTLAQFTNNFRNRQHEA